MNQLKVLSMTPLKLNSCFCSSLLSHLSMPFLLWTTFMSSGAVTPPSLSSFSITFLQALSSSSIRLNYILMLLYSLKLLFMYLPVTGSISLKRQSLLF